MARGFVTLSHCRKCRSQDRSKLTGQARVLTFATQKLTIRTIPSVNTWVVVSCNGMTIHPLHVSTLNTQSSPTEYNLHFPCVVSVIPSLLQPNGQIIIIESLFDESWISTFPTSMTAFLTTHCLQKKTYHRVQIHP